LTDRKETDNLELLREKHHRNTSRERDKQMARNSILSQLTRRSGGGGKPAAAPVKRGKAAPKHPASPKKAAPKAAAKKAPAKKAASRKAAVRSVAKATRQGARGPRKQMRTVKGVPENVRELMGSTNPAKRRLGRTLYMRAYRENLRKKGITTAYGRQVKYKSPETKKAALARVGKGPRFGKHPSAAAIKAAQKARAKVLATNPRAGRRGKVARAPLARPPRRK
jgi:hypothetical protein